MLNWGKWVIFFVSQWKIAIYRTYSPPVCRNYFYFHLKCHPRLYKCARMHPARTCKLTWLHTCTMMMSLKQKELCFFAHNAKKTEDKNLSTCCQESNMGTSKIQYCVFLKVWNRILRGPGLEFIHISATENCCYLKNKKELLSLSSYNLKELIFFISLNKLSFGKIICVLSILAICLVQYKQQIPPIKADLKKRLKPLFILLKARRFINHP